MVIALSGKIQLNNVFGVNERCYVNIQEINRMAKSQNVKRSKKKPPQKTAKEKRQAKREKKNK